MATNFDNMIFIMKAGKVIKSRLLQDICKVQNSFTNGDEWNY